MIKLLAFVSVAFAAIIAHSVRGSEKVEPVPPDTSPTPIEKTPLMQERVPQRILESILKETATLANVPREKLAIVRAESVVWNDGSLGCPEPGMMYTQALVNGYWVVIEAGVEHMTSASTPAVGSTCAPRGAAVPRGSRTSPEPNHL